MLRRIKIIMPIVIGIRNVQIKRFISHGHESINVQPNFVQSLNIPKVRTMSSGVITKENEIDCDGLLKIKDDGKIILIDVRRQDELQELGKIEGAIHIPLNELGLALEYLSDEEFKLKYGIPKPPLDAPVIYYCKSGGRSLRALQLAMNLGYTNSKYLTGGFTEWQQCSKKKAD